MKTLRQIIERVRNDREQPWGMATLVETRGSTYRKCGARMLVDSSGATTGVLSGGCLEEEIAERAMDIIRGEPPTLLSFDTRRLYGCDGCVRIFVERVEAAGTSGNFLTGLGEAMERRQTCRLRTCYEGATLGTTLLAPMELVVEQPGTFVHCVPLPLRLLLVGSGPEIVPLRQLAHILGWITLHCAHPSDIPDEFKADRQTAAVVMTHNFGRDLATLARLLPLNLPYVGLLGPRKRHRQLMEELHARTGFELANLSSIYAPAGLDLGSEAPEEIALSILAEASAVLANRNGGHLRQRATAIHFAVEEPAADVA